MGIQYGHVNIGRFAPVKVKIQYTVGSHPAQLYPRFPLDNGKPFDLAGMEMIAPGDPRFCGRKGDLSTRLQFDGFYENSPVVSIPVQPNREMVGNIHVTPESVKQISFKSAVQRRENTLFKITGLVLHQQIQYFRDFNLCGMGYTEFPDGSPVDDSIKYMLHKFSHIDQFQLPVGFYPGRFLVCQLMTKGGHDRVIKRISKRSENIGNKKSGERRIVLFSPSGQYFPAFTL
jgi:hypothetical protein